MHRARTGAGIRKTSSLTFSVRFYCDDVSACIYLVTLSAGCSTYFEYDSVALVRKPRSYRHLRRLATNLVTRSG